jgi:hypothetical protein
MTIDIAEHREGMLYRTLAYLEAFASYRLDNGLMTGIAHYSRRFIKDFAPATEWDSLCDVFELSF